MFINDLRNRCAKAGRIVIYGCGLFANITYLYLKKSGLGGKVVCFAAGEKEAHPSKIHNVDVVEFHAGLADEEGVLVLLSVRKGEQKAAAETLRRQGIERFLCVDGPEVTDAFYQLLYEEPVAGNKILFSNMNGLGYGGNPKYIARKLLESDPGRQLDLVWVVFGRKYSLPDRIRTVEAWSMEYYRELATARVWVDNVRKDIDVRKREGQYYIQTWHGAAPGKKVEKDVPEASSPPGYRESAKHDSKMADLFLSGSEFYTELYRKAFWYDGEIMKAGLPRQDIFWNMDGVRKKVYDAFGIEPHLALALYAPTFRRHSDPEVYNLDIRMVKDALEQRFGRKFAFAVSRHPNNRYLEYVLDCTMYLDVGAYEDFEELLVAADVLITDYSGCVYDYSYTRRPCFLYQNDYESYVKERDFYVPVRDLPYVRARSNTELAEKILEFDEKKYLERLDRFMKRMQNYDTGCASKKVAERIMHVVNLD